jgi:site-specific recombinase XerD
MRWLADKYVFMNPKTEKPFRDLGNSFESACVKASIEGVTFHTLRHTYASRLVQGGVDLHTVSKRLGHGDLKTTARYAHLALDHHDPKEAAALDNPGAKVEPVVVKHRQRQAAR